MCLVAHILPVVGFAASYAQGEDVLLKVRGESHRGNRWSCGWVIITRPLKFIQIVSNKIQIPNPCIISLASSRKRNWIVAFEEQEYIYIQIYTCSLQWTAPELNNPNNMGFDLLEFNSPSVSFDCRCGGSKNYRQSELQSGCYWQGWFGTSVEEGEEGGQESQIEGRRKRRRRRRRVQYHLLYIPTQLLCSCICPY